VGFVPIAPGFQPVGVMSCIRENGFSDVIGINYRYFLDSKSKTQKPGFLQEIGLFNYFLIKLKKYLEYQLQILS
jgi:hypothetical protein